MVENLPTGQKIIRLAAVELLIAKHDVVEDAKTIQVPRDASFGEGGFKDNEVIRGVVDKVEKDKQFAFVVTHKGRVFLGLNAQLATVKLGSVVEFTVKQAEKVGMMSVMCDVWRVAFDV